MGLSQQSGEGLKAIDPLPQQIRFQRPKDFIMVPQIFDSLAPFMELVRVFAVQVGLHHPPSAAPVNPSETGCHCVEASVLNR